VPVRIAVKKNGHGLDKESLYIDIVELVLDCIITQHPIDLEGVKITLMF